ncbi:hypothetical protein [Paracoccus sp. (in: a-proteobacteria)]|uniref:hypothetical protein n=1 Tax=Paracoccus sp. TaxID=267 RepID=UPI00289FFB45|nr:hypothetical protein [Paracoccus sp. (in: a-proteobacteria)]
MSRPVPAANAMAVALPVVMAMAALVTGTTPGAAQQVSASPDAPTAMAEAKVSNPSIAFGLGGIADWSTQSPFIDVFKTSRPWIGHLPGQWGGADPVEMANATDAQGWLLRMPKGVSHVSTLILTELPSEMVSAAGRYRLRYQGAGKIEIKGARVIAERPGEIEFEYRPTGQAMVEISISQIDESDPLRKISVVHARNWAAHDAGEIFNPAWLARIAPTRSLRFMDWMQTNDSPNQDWQARALPTDASWAGPKGVPLEVMIALANQTHTDPWFTLPHLAPPDYVEAFATLVRDQLDPALKPWFEYSNEVWNWQFQQAQWANEQGRALWPDLGTAWVEFYAGRSVEMAQSIDKVYGPQSDQKVFKVISTQTGWIGLEDSILEAPAWRAMAPDRAAPASHFNAYAITGYFDGGLGRDDKPKVVKEWLARSREMAKAEATKQGLSRVAFDSYVAAHRFDHAQSLALQELRDGSVTGDGSGSLADLYKTFAHHKAVADRYGLQLVMYEGGTHIVGVGPWLDDEELSDFFIWLNQSAGMGQLYSELLAGWKAAGGTMFNAFVDIGRHSKFGSWGNLRHIDDDLARWDALLAFNRDTPAWWSDPREAGAFTSP